MDGTVEIFGDDLGSTSSFTVCDEMVTMMAGNIYSELEKLIDAYGQESVTGLMPLLVSVLESLETTSAQAKEREEQLELVDEDLQRLVIQYERERGARKRAEERCNEMEDGIDQERKLFKATLKTMETQTKAMETKARSYADQIVGLEEQKTVLNKELTSLTQVHAKIAKNYKELRYQRTLSMEAARNSGRNTPLQDIEKKVLLLDFQDAPSSIENTPDTGCTKRIPAEKCLSGDNNLPINESKSQTSVEAPVKNITGGSNRALKEELKSSELTLEDLQEIPELPENPEELQSEVEQIINSTPELNFVSELIDESTPKTHADDDDEEDVARNNDSLFEELCGSSPEFVSAVDEGSDLQGISSSMDALMMENTQLRDALSDMDMARKSLIARVEELTTEREALQRENENLTQSLTRCESRLRETDQDLQRTQNEIEEARKQSREDAEVDIPAAQRKRFTRAEMARVLMERNQYKEKLMELQDAVRRTEMLRASKEIQAVEMKKPSFWRVFDRLFSSSNGPQGKVTASTPSDISTVNRGHSDPSAYASTQRNSAVGGAFANAHTRGISHNDDAERMPLRGIKHELYRHIRAHIWKTHGRAQLHGWSNPPAAENKGEDHNENEIKGFPVLMQLRLLDQKDPSTKSESFPSLVWICSGTHSVSEVMVIDASSANHVMDQFVFPKTHVLCVTCVPGCSLDYFDQQDSKEDSQPSVKGPTMWLGTQEGSLFVHSALSDWRNCLQKIQLKDAIHSITHTGDRVTATLGDGTLAIFRQNPDRTWDLENPRVVDLGRPQQSIRCSVAVQNEVWCGYRNRIYVVDPRSAKIKRWFEATPHTQSQVRHLAKAEEGVWASVRLDSVLRLFHGETGQLLQEVELDPFIQKMLGSNNFGLSMAKVSSMEVFCDRLWVGTATGMILSIPFSSDRDRQTAAADVHAVPYCSLENAQVSFHGHRDAVKFFACVPGCINMSSSRGVSKHTGNFNMLVMSGGEGYINFRIGDETGDTCEDYGDLLISNPRGRRSERSHLIVWQLQI
uniref:Uncharacterized protein n=1 Tax=Leptobrachium leishanense TaxID=445787 RepID=A0A8C5PDM8_9ANUR